jgi:hypothetical protein
LTTSARPRTCSFSSSPATTDSGSMPVKLVGDHVGQLAEPEVRHRGQHRALAGDRVGQDHVEGGEAIGGDDQQLVFANARRYRAPCRDRATAGW